MKKPKRTDHEFNIVLVGDFNPQIFQPSWFVLQKLLGEREGESAKVELIHPDVAVFSLDWIRFQVDRNRVVAATRDEGVHEALRDLITGAFSVLMHTPLRMIGINHTFDYMVDDEATWHKIGDTLAPKDIWKKLVDGPGLTSLTIQSKDIENGIWRNKVRVTTSHAGAKQSLRIHINDHYELINQSIKVTGSRDIVSILTSEWENSRKKVADIERKLFEEL